MQPKQANTFPKKPTTTPITQPPSISCIFLVLLMSQYSQLKPY